MLQYTCIYNHTGTIIYDWSLSQSLKKPSPHQKSSEEMHDLHIGAEEFNWTFRISVSSSKEEALNMMSVRVRESFSLRVKQLPVTPNTVAGLSILQGRSTHVMWHMSWSVPPYGSVGGGGWRETYYEIWLQGFLGVDPTPALLYHEWNTLSELSTTSLRHILKAALFSIVKWSYTNILQTIS